MSLQVSLQVSGVLKEYLIECVAEGRERVSSREVYRWYCNRQGRVVHQSVVSSRLLKPLREFQLLRATWERGVYLFDRALAERFLSEEGVSAESREILPPSGESLSEPQSLADKFLSCCDGSMSLSADLIYDWYSKVRPSAKRTSAYNLIIKPLLERGVLEEIGSTPSGRVGRPIKIYYLSKEGVSAS